MSNTNCLHGLRCPRCAGYEPLLINSETHFVVYDDGADDHGDVVWDAGSPCECGRCRYNGRVIDFAESQPRLYRCDNCSAERRSIDELRPVKDLAQRLDPGGAHPAGECPLCGALCYLTDGDERPADAAYRKAAERLYIADGQLYPGDEQLEIDAGARLDPRGDGAYVEAWVWVPAAAAAEIGAPDNDSG